MQYAWKAMTSFGLSWEAFVKSGIPCSGLSVALNSCPTLKEGEGLKAKGPCPQEPKVSKPKLTYGGPDHDIAS